MDELHFKFKGAYNRPLFLFDNSGGGDYLNTSDPRAKDGFNSKISIIPGGLIL